MRYTKKKNYQGTIRKVWDDNKEICYGVVGTVGDMLTEGILDYCDGSPGTWMFIPAPGTSYKTRFGRTREETVENL